MGRHEKKPSKKKVKIEWSKLVCLLTILAGLLIVQECLFLMYLCIKGGYTATTGVGEAVIIAGANGYLGLAKSDHKRGGITFEAAKAKDFTEDEDKNSPPI